MAQYENVTKALYSTVESESVFRGLNFCLEPEMESNFYFLKPLKFCGLWRKSIWTDGISIVGAPPKKDRLRNTAANMVNQNITIR